MCRKTVVIQEKPLLEVEAFPFPSTGKVCSKRRSLLPRRVPRTRFHSLQPGKCVASCGEMCEICEGCVFRFPSTGKVYSKPSTNTTRTIRWFGEFRFPSTGKVCRKAVLDAEEWVAEHKFRFPSTGKVCRKQMTRHCSPGLKFDRFDSLQPGKCVARILDETIQHSSIK